MDTKGIDWEVQHYGLLLDDYETVISGRHIRQKIYRYGGKLYIETWYNGMRLLFHELFD